jgi:hypothetical protein
VYIDLSVLDFAEGRVKSHPLDTQQYFAKYITNFNLSFVYTIHFKASVAFFNLNFNTHRLWPDLGFWKPITGNHRIVSE